MNHNLLFRYHADMTAEGLGLELGSDKVEVLLVFYVNGARMKSAAYIPDLKNLNDFFYNCTIS